MFHDYKTLFQSCKTMFQFYKSRVFIGKLAVNRIAFRDIGHDSA